MPLRRVASGDLSETSGSKAASAETAPGPYSRLAADTSLTILSGDDAQTLPMMANGAAGVISVAANVVPAQMARLCATQDHDLHASLVTLFTALFCQTNPIPLKFALAEMGRIRNELRLPLTPLDAPHHETVRDALRHAGVL